MVNGEYKKEVEYEGVNQFEALDEAMSTSAKSLLGSPNNFI